MKKNANAYVQWFTDAFRKLVEPAEVSNGQANSLSDLMDEIEDKFNDVYITGDKTFRNGFIDKYNKALQSGLFPEDLKLLPPLQTNRVALKPLLIESLKQINHIAFRTNHSLNSALIDDYIEQLKLQLKPEKLLNFDEIDERATMMAISLDTVLTESFPRQDDQLTAMAITEIGQKLFQKNTIKTLKNFELACQKKMFENNLEPLLTNAKQGLTNYLARDRCWRHWIHAGPTAFLGFFASLFDRKSGKMRAQYILTRLNREALTPQTRLCYLLTIFNSHKPHQLKYDVARALGFNSPNQTRRFLKKTLKEFIKHSAKTHEEKKQMEKTINTALLDMRDQFAKKNIGDPRSIDSDFSINLKLDQCFNNFSSPAEQLRHQLEQFRQRFQ